MSNMSAVGFHRHLPLTEHESLIDLELPRPEATGHDLLVEIKAVSVNPVDTKVRAHGKDEDARRSSVTMQPESSLKSAMMPPSSKSVMKSITPVRFSAPGQTVTSNSSMNGSSPKSRNG